MTIKTYIDPHGNAHYSKPRVIVIGDRQYTPVSDERLIEAGWTIDEKGIQETPEPVYKPSYEELVEQYIREHGYPSYGAELAVLNNYAEDSATFADAYAAYIAVRHAAKEWASQQEYREGEL